jgi:hypothetical protein
MRMVYLVRGVAGVFAAGVLALAVPGCDSGPKENPKSIGVYNPDPNSPLKDVTLENEYQNLDKIRAGTNYKKK